MLLLQPLFRGERKRAQIGQTEPNRRFGLPEGVRGYVERRSLFKTQGMLLQEFVR